MALQLPARPTLRTVLITQGPNQARGTTFRVTCTPILLHWSIAQVPLYM